MVPFGEGEGRERERERERKKKITDNKWNEIVIDERIGFRVTELLPSGPPVRD